MLELLIELDVEKHIISRRVLISVDIELKQLHDIIQILFGWKGYHMHQYIKTKDSDGNMMYFDSDPPFSGRDYFLTEGIDIESFLLYGKVEYVYDMGDYWEHKITLVNSHQNVIGDQNVTCIGGVHDTPPEDIGGVGGYIYFLEVMADKTHPEYEQLKSWSNLTKTAKFNQQKINNSLLKKYG